ESGPLSRCSLAIERKFFMKLYPLLLAAVCIGCSSSESPGTGMEPTDAASVEASPTSEAAPAEASARGAAAPETSAAVEASAPDAATTGEAGPEDFVASMSDFDCSRIGEWTTVGIAHYKNALGHTDEMLSVARSPNGGTFPVGTIVQLNP